MPSLEQVRAVLERMPAGTDIEKRDRALIAFLILTGARDGALITFKMKHLDVSAERLEQPTAVRWLERLVGGLEIANGKVSECHRWGYRRSGYRADTPKATPRFTGCHRTPPHHVGWEIRAKLLIFRNQRIASDAIGA